MKGHYFKRIFLFAGILALLALAYGLYRYFEPVRSVASQKPDISLTDEQLLNAFEADAQKAETQYKNKVLEISGTVNKVQGDSSGYKIIFDKKGKYIVVCSCAANVQKEVQSLKQNEKVTVKGVYTGFVIIDDQFMIPAEIKIDQCSIVK